LSSFFNRSAIVTAITESLSSYFGNVGAQLSYFQLLDITLPSDFYDAVQQTQVTSTQILQANVTQQMSVVIAETNLLAAQGQATVILTQAVASAQSITIDYEQQALAVQAQFSQQTIALLALKNSLNMTTPELLNYLLIDSLKSTVAKITISVQKPQFTYAPTN